VSVTFTDNSDQFNKDLVESMNDGLSLMGVYLSEVMRANIGSEGGRAIAVSRKVRNQNRRRFRAVAAGESIGRNEGRRYFIASPVGNFPGNRTGTLKRSITSTKARNLAVTVGSSVKYAVWLETGWQRRTPLTPKQLRYLHAINKELRNAGIVIEGKNGSKGGAVNARPWLRRSVRENWKQAVKHFTDRASESFVAKWGAQ
jgi:hypothetical protein